MLGRYLKKRRISRGMEIEDSMMTVTEKQEAVIERPFARAGLRFGWGLIVFFIAIIVTRVFYLDVMRAGYYEDISKGNRIRSIVINAPRGKILDKSGKVLVSNVSSMDAIIIPSDLPEEYERRREIAHTVADILGVDAGNVEAAIESQNRRSPEPILLKENITQDQSLVLAERRISLPGIYISNTAIRNYENSVIFSPVIGYEGKITREELAKNSGYIMTDYIGKAGIEKQYENQLRGVFGAHQVEVDSLGNVKKNLGIVDPKPGNDLILNIDEELQKKIYDSLNMVLEKNGTKTAAAVAIDPRTGGVLAMVSIPSYDNNIFAQGITNESYRALIGDKSLPLFNRAVNGEYPPGSTFKPAVAAAALTEHTITPETTVMDSSGAINVGSWRFGDWKTHGLMDVRSAIAESCDVFFYSIGGGYGNISGLGMDRMKKYADLFGLGSLTGIDFPSEASGFIPDEKWKQEKVGEKWYIGDSYHSSIGQGFITATPLQIANYTAALANGGTLFSPRIVNRVKKIDGSYAYVSPTIIRKDFIPESAMRVVREGMRQTVEKGSARSLSVLPVAVAGKTGTAQFGSEDKTHAWFISFAPYDNPEIAMAVLMEGGGEGSSSAVPATREIYDWYFKRRL